MHGTNTQRRLRRSRTRSSSRSRAEAGSETSQGSQSPDAGGYVSATVPPPKKRRKLPGWMMGQKLETKPKTNAQTIAAADASPSVRSPPSGGLVYLGLRTSQKDPSAGGSSSAAAGEETFTHRYSEGKSWDEIKQGFLDMLAALERSEKDKGDTIRAGAYSKAANAIRDHAGELRNGKEAKKLKGIGPKVAAKFDEFLEKGSLDRVERDRGDPRAVALQALNTVNGVGPVLAKKLLDEDGIDSVASLVAAVRNDKVRINNDVRVGLKHYAELSQRIPRKEVSSPQ